MCSPLNSTLFPYTTLFRSPIWLLRLFRRGKARSEQVEMNEHILLLDGRGARLWRDFLDEDAKGLSSWLRKHEGYASRQRSEEHTSELQSHSDLVCRLLLEK